MIIVCAQNAAGPEEREQRKEKRHRLYKGTIIILFFQTTKIYFKHVILKIYSN